MSQGGAGGPGTAWAVGGFGASRGRLHPECLEEPTCMWESGTPVRTWQARVGLPGGVGSQGLSRLCSKGVSVLAFGLGRFSSGGREQ